MILITADKLHQMIRRQVPVSTIRKVYQISQTSLDLPVLATRLRTALPRKHSRDLCISTN